MKLELSEKETTAVFGTYGNAVKDAAEQRAQVQRLSEKLSEAETAKRTAIRAKEDSDYSLSQSKQDLDYWKREHKDLSARNTTVINDLANVRRELVEAKRVIGEAASKATVIPPAPSLPEMETLVQGRIQEILANTLDAVAHGQTINAIKLVREATGAGLKEAKQMVEGNFLSVPKKPASGGCGG